MKYLGLIRSIAFLRQYQKTTHKIRIEDEDVDYLEVDLEDIGIANELAHQVLGRCLDELPPQTRLLLSRLYLMVEEECRSLELSQEDYRFTRKEVRTRLGLSAEQARIHLNRLVELEYLLPHKGGRGQSFVYELLYDGKGTEGEPFVSGLISIDALQEKISSKSNSTISSLGY